MSHPVDFSSIYRERLVLLDAELLDLISVITDRDPGDENPPNFGINWPRRQLTCAPLRPHVRMVMRRQRVKLNTNLTNWR